MTVEVMFAVEASVGARRQHCWSAPAAIVGVAGVTAIETSVGGETVSRVEP